MLSDTIVSVAHVDPHGLSKPTQHSAHSHSSEKVSFALGMLLAYITVLSVSIGWLIGTHDVPSIFKILQAFSTYLAIDM